MYEYRKTFYKPFHRSPQVKLNNILNTDLYHSKYNLLKTALNKDIKINTNYRINQTKPKRQISPKDQKKNSIKIKNETFSPENNEIKNNKINKNKNNNNIVQELENILNNNIKKTEKFIDSFKDLKIENLSFINKYTGLVPPIEKRIYAKFADYTPENHKFLVEELKQNKAAQNLYKMSPLTLKKDKDVYFYYIGLHKGMKMNNNDQKYIRYLENTRDYLDFVKIDKNPNDPEVKKEIKKRNNKYTLGFDERVKREEKLKELKLQKKLIAEEKESKIMIEQTKKTVNMLSKNKNLFNIDIYNNKSRKYFYTKNNNNNNIDYTSTMYSGNSSGSVDSLKYVKNEYSVRNKYHSNEKYKTTIGLKKNNFLNTDTKLKSNISNFNNGKIKNIKLKTESPKNCKNFRDFVQNSKSASKHIQRVSIPYARSKNNYLLKNISILSNSINNTKIENKNKVIKIVINSNNSNDNLTKLFEKTKNSNKLLNEKNMKNIYHYLNEKGIKPEVVKAYKFGSPYHFDSIKTRVNKINIEAEEKSISKDTFSDEKLYKFKQINELNDKINNLDKNYVKTLSKL